MPSPSKSIALCVGTRPEIIKMAPVYRALRDQSMPVTLIHSGQHDQMAWPLYDFFGFQPDVVIDLERQDSSLEHLSCRLIDSIGKQFRRIDPSSVLVHGDTSTAAMGALTAFYQKLPIGHVEAGLRTKEMFDPFPEEMNRSVIGRMARWHFAPTTRAVANLAGEGLVDQVHMVGNTAIDAAQLGLARLRSYVNERPERFPARLMSLCNQPLSQRVLLVTAHRRENWGNGIAQIALAVRDWLEAQHDYVAVWPVHGNPAVSEVVRDVFANVDPSVAERIILTEPLDYPAVLLAMQLSWLILTDSGGIQEEAAALDKPVLVLRETTERPELIDSGRGRLTGARREVILKELMNLHESPKRYARMRAGANPFGDGRAAQRIASILAHEQMSQTELAA